MINSFSACLVGGVDIYLVCWCSRE